MADLGKTDAEWTRLLGREFGLCGLAPIRLLREIRDRFRLTRTQVRVMNDVDGNVGGDVTLAGVDPGNNCTELGLFYVRITGSGPYTVSLYKATGGGGSDLMAQGSGSAGATVTLSASNSSGVTGTWKLAGSVTAVIDDSLQVQAFVDFLGLLHTVFTENDGIDDDPHTRAALAAGYATAAARLGEAVAALEAAIASAFLGNADNPTGRGNDFAQANESSLITDVATDDGDGNVSRLRGGLLEALRLAMAEETTGSTQYLVKRVASASAGTAASTNQGVGTIASHTPAEKCPAGRITLACVAGVDTGNLGSETFDGYFYITDRDRPTPITGVRVGKTFYGPNGIGPFTITRTLAKTGDVGSNTDLGAVSGFAVSGERNANTDDGVLYWQIVANGSNWDLSFYKSSSKAASSLVAKATNVATGASFTATSQNGSGLQVTGTIGSSPTTTTAGTISLQPFRVTNASGVADKFTITVTVTAGAGRYQTLLAEHFAPDGAQLNSTTSGSETISDDYVRANTFAAFAVEDN